MISQPSVEERLEKDPFNFPSFGRYQIIMSFVLFMVTIQFYWSTEEPAIYMMLNEAYCSEPANVTNYCSNECKKVSFSHKLVESNLITLFNWICERENAFKPKSAVDLASIIIGAICWHYFSRRFGMRVTILLGVPFNIINDIVFLIFPVEYIFWVNLFFHKFSCLAVYIPMEVLLIEIISSQYYPVVLVMQFIGVIIGQLLYTAIWEICRHWLWLKVTKLILSFMILFSSIFILESPRWYFLKDNCEAAIRTMEKIYSINKKPSDSVRLDIEQAWRKSRTQPTSKDGFFTIFKFPLIRTMYFRYIFLAISISIGTSITQVELTNYALSQNVQLGSRYLSIHLFIALIIWILLAIYGNGKVVMVLTLFIGGLVFLLLALNNLPDVRLALSIIDNIASQIVLAELQVFLLQFVPGTIRQIHIYINLILFFSGFLLTGLMQLFQKISWFPFLLSCIIYLIGSNEATELVERKNLPYRSCIRDVELHLKQYQQNRASDRI